VPRQWFDAALKATGVVQPVLLEDGRGVSFGDIVFETAITADNPTIGNRIQLRVPLNYTQNQWCCFVAQNLEIKTIE
jgi:hypothetical protein